MDSYERRKIIAAEIMKFQDELEANKNPDWTQFKIRMIREQGVTQNMIDKLRSALCPNYTVVRDKWRPLETQ